MNTFPANVPSLLLLAWLASHPEHRNAVIPPESSEEPWRPRPKGTKIIEAIVEQELVQADQTHRYAPVFLQLVRHQFARFDLDYIEWALRGEKAVYFREDALPWTADENRDAFAAQSVTRVAQDALAAQELLRSYVQSALGLGRVNEIEKGGLMLQQLLLREAATMFPQLPGTFLLTELLYHSLQQIEWKLLASWLLHPPSELPH